MEDEYRALRAKQSLDDEREKKLQKREEFNKAQKDLILYREQIKDQEKVIDDQKKE